MTALQRTRASVLLIAGGVGSTPNQALFETFDIGDGRPSHIYRARTPADVIFRHELWSGWRSSRLGNAAGSRSAPPFGQAEFVVNISNDPCR